MIAIILPCIVILLYGGVSNTTQKTKRVEADISLSEEKIIAYNRILNGLNSKCLYNIDEQRRDLIVLDNSARREECIQDSILYENSVREFYRADHSIIAFLLRFKTDKSQCFWVYRANPYSSTVSSTALQLARKDIAALVLIQNYLCYKGQDYIQTFETDRPSNELEKYTLEYKADSSLAETITIVSGVNLKVLLLPDVNKLEQWYQENETLSVKDLRQKYQRYLLPLQSME